MGGETIGDPSGRQGRQAAEVGAGQAVFPAAIWFFAFFGLIFLQLLAANLALFIAWLAFRRKTCLLHAAVLLPAFFFLPAYVQLCGPPETPPAQQTLKVMTYNVHLFGINARTKTLETLPAIAAFVRHEAPDIICLQEMGLFDTLAVKQAFAGYPHTHFHLRRQRNNTWFATATLSRYPVTGKGVISFAGTGNVCIYTDVLLDSQNIRVYNNHLESTRLNLTRTFSRLKQDENRNDEIKDVSVRLRDAFVKRAKQVDTVAVHIKQSPHPVLVCGDFNDLPMSYTYRTMKGQLSDAFVEAGTGVPSSFRSFLPAFRIDYIFNDATLEAQQYYIPKLPSSDHYPVVAVFAKAQR